MRPLRFPLAATLAFASSLAVGGSALAETARVTLLHTTDLHGALTAWDYPSDRPAARGLEKLATMVRRVRDEGTPVVLVDAGDVLPEAASDAFGADAGSGRPEPMMVAMTRMGYDAMAVGNHEFDHGLEALARARRAAGFPWLAANVVRATDGTPAFGTSIVRAAGPVRVGVVGVCTPAVPSWVDSSRWAGLRFESPVEAARREVARLRGAERCDVVVIVAHTGLEKDEATGLPRGGDTPDENWGERLATEVPGADVVILGHTHVVVPSLGFGAALATQAGKWGEHLGRVDLELARGGASERWSLASKRARVIAVADSVASDSALAAFARPYHEATEAALDERLGTASADIGSPRGRFEDGPVWELLQRAQLDASGAEVSLGALFDPGATIRRGPITRRDLLRIYPYDNTLVVVELTGAQLKETLERAAEALAPYTYEADRPLMQPGFAGFHLDAAEGATYEIDLTRPVGDRILHLAVQGTPVAPERVLRVAVNNYRVNGGGGFEAVRRAPRRWRSDRPVRELLADYIRKVGTLAPEVTANWTLLPDYAATPERPLIDRLVRQQVVPREEVHRLVPDEPARRGDVAYWLARAYGWREKRLSGAFSDVPDSLEPWLDGLLRRRVLGEQGTADRLDPFRIADLWTALDWCEAAAVHERYALASRRGDPSFRRSLLTGVGLSPLATRARAPGDTSRLAEPARLTRSQLLGIVSNARFPTVRVLETTDFHGAILPGARERRTGRPVGGSAVLAAWIEKLRAENPEGTVLVDGGDCFQGTMISNLQFGRPVVEQMNALRYSAMAIGNHEFDWTADTLARRVREMRFAALGANMVEKRSGRRPAWARSDTSFARRGVPIGVLGLCYVHTPSVTLPAHVAHLRFEDDSATAARVVPRLRREGAGIVLGVGHLPAESDSLGHAVSGDLLRLARGVKGVDAWFGGHSHNQVLDEVDGVPLMISGSHGQVVGICDLTWDPVARRVIERHTRLVATYADEIAPDSAMLARVRRWNVEVAPVAAVPIGANARTLLRNREGESALGDLVADAIRTAVGADIAMQNSGGLRADLPEGPLTRGAIYEVMPFDNTIVTLAMTGAEIRQALEDALRWGRVTQQSGLRYTFDRDAPAGRRVVAVTLADGSPLEGTRTYKVAMNDFMASGGDNYDAAKLARERIATGILVRDVIERYVAERSRAGATLDVRPDGRVRRADARAGGGD